MEIENRENSILSGLDKIPDDILINHIKPILKPETLVWLDKENYTRYHSCIEKQIKHRPSIYHPSGVYESYIRGIIRLDYSFVFEQILNDKIHNWIKIKNYRYNDKIYSTYLNFVFDFSLDNNSVKCRKLINNMANALYTKNWYKKTKSKNNKWRK